MGNRTLSSLERGELSLRDSPPYYADWEQRLRQILLEHGPVTHESRPKILHEIYQYIGAKDCEHEPMLVHFRQSNGVIVYQTQCARCWSHLSSAIKYSSLTDEERASAPERVDRQTHWGHTEAIKLAMLQRVNQLVILEPTEEEQWWADYNAYLRSPEWQSLRERVLRRDGYMCQSCLTRQATTVHHRQYRKRYEPRSWEHAYNLVSVCSECHQRAHPEKDL